MMEQAQAQALQTEQSAWPPQGSHKVGKKGKSHLEPRWMNAGPKVGKGMGQDENMKWNKASKMGRGGKWR